MKQSLHFRLALVRQQDGWGRSARRLLVAFVVLCLSLSASGQSRETLRAGDEAEKAEAASNVGRALDLYAKALASNPQWTDGWWKDGRLLYQEHRFPEAGQAFGWLIRLAPSNPLGFALLGLCEFEEADWDNALLHLNKALNLGGLPPDIAQATEYHLALVLMRQGNYGGALFTLNVLFRQAPDFPGLKPALGAAELHLKEPPVLTSAEFAAVDAAGSAAVAALQTRPDDAENAYRDLLTRFPNQPFAHLSFGLFLESQNREDEAQKELTAETKLSPTSAVPWLWLARVALARLNSEAARSYAAHARELDPSDSLSFLIEGRSLMLEQQWESALVPLRVAEERAPQSSEVHYALASVYGELHRKPEADKERQLFLQASQTADALNRDTLNHGVNP